MKPARPSKRKIDWYFPRINGRIAVSKTRGPARVCDDNVEARHRDSWRRNVRSFFAVLLAAGLTAAPLWGADAPLSSLHKPAKKAAVKAPKVEKTYPKEAKAVQKTVSGTVVGVLKRAISVEVGQSDENGAEEVLIPIEDGLKLSNASALSDLSRGDLVEVRFLQHILQKKKGEEPSVLDTRALEIRVIEKAADRAAAAVNPAGVVP